MIKIISGWSNKGGSTFSFINLTNTLNKCGYETKFYGPHTWHLDKCNGGIITPNFKINDDDLVITHFINIPRQGKKFILSCHEKDLFEVGKMNPIWDEVVFLNNKHRKYHSGYTGSFTIIPNLKEPFIKRDKVNLNNIAGIIGSYDINKQTHISIQRALNDGCEKIYLFGNISDQNYYDNMIKPLLNDKVIEYGFVSDKQKMYDMVGRVYLSSKSEVASLVKDECYSTGTIFYGNLATDNDGEDISNDEIIKRWVKLLDL